MKKIILSLLISGSTFTFAQTHFGIKAGYNLSNMKWKLEKFDDVKFDSKSYFYAGAFAEHLFNNKFAIQGELIFTSLGGKIQEELTQIIANGEIVETGIAEYKFNYPQLQVPISAKYYFIKNFNVHGGFNFAFNINPTAEVNFTVDNKSDIENVKTVNIFPFLGAEVMIVEHFSIDARYNFGAFNTNNSGVDNRFNFFQIGLGYRFR
ncbi:outer membrane beta-barrel protein [Epilithonimonas sp.]|uniref:outer membrane beta-barrel protein n=1 Tax=Epilithonimonas sp. TaxID=2894511 RepID=UPI0035B4D3E7